MWYQEAQAAVGSNSNKSRYMAAEKFQSFYITVMQHLKYEVRRANVNFHVSDLDLLSLQHVWFLVLFPIKVEINATAVVPMQTFYNQTKYFKQHLCCS